MKLKTKFIALFVAFALIPVLISGIVTQITVKNNNYKEAQNRLQAQRDTSKLGVSNLIDLTLKVGLDISAREDINNYLTAVSAGTPDETLQTAITQRFQKDMKRYTTFDDIILLDKNGVVIVDPSNSILGQDISKEDYYVKMKESKKEQVSNVKKSLSTNKPIFVASIPILENNELKGTLLASVSLANISEQYIKNIKIGDTGYVFIMESDGTTIAHPKETEILQKNFIKIDAAKKILADKKGVTEYTYSGIKKMVAYDTDEKLGWTYIATIPLEELTKTSDLAVKIMLITTLITALVALVLSVLIAKGIANPIVNVSNTMGKISEGDFTVSLNVNGKDEIAEMSEKINTTLDSLKHSIEGVQDTSLIVGESSVNLKNSALQMSSSAGEVATAIQEVARGSSEQSAELVDIVDVLNNFSEELQTVKNNLLNVNSKTNESQDKAVNGKDQIDVLSESINSITTSFNEVISKINGLSTTVSRIGNITDVINNISEQTNLLALNAAIEAARAGDQGKGFAVVAEEVRKLAEESKKSSEEILSLIKSISSETSDVIGTTEDVKKLLNNQEGIAQDTIKAFENIINSIGDIAPLMDKTKISLDNANKSKDIVNNKVQAVSAVSEEVCASAEEIAASSEELMASSEEVSKLAENMDNAAETLKDKVGVFKIK